MPTTDMPYYACYAILCLLFHIMPTRLCLLFHTIPAMPYYAYNMPSIPYYAYLEQSGKYSGVY